MPSAARCRSDHPDLKGCIFCQTSVPHRCHGRTNLSFQAEASEFPQNERWNAGAPSPQRLPTLKRLRQQIHHAPQALELTHVPVQVQQLVAGWPQPLMLRLATRSINANWRVTQASRHRCVPRFDEQQHRAAARSRSTRRSATAAARSFGEKKPTSRPLRRAESSAWSGTDPTTAQPQAIASSSSSSSRRIVR